MTQERRKDDARPTEELVFTDRNLTAAGLAHLEAERASACLVHAKDDVWVGVGSKDALRGLLSEDSANKAAAVDLTSPTADPAKSIGSAEFFNLLLDYADAPDISTPYEAVLEECYAMAASQ